MALELSQMHFSAPRPSGKSPLLPPAGNESFFYPVSRLLSFWPIINGNNATFIEDDVAPLLDSGDTEVSTLGKLANLWHKKGKLTGNQIIGSIARQHHIPGVGIDIVTRVDRKALTAYDLTPADFKQGGEYSSVSQEMYCDRNKSKFIVMLKPESSRLEDQKVFSAEEAASMGLRRTKDSDPLGAYLYDGKYKVVEACVPIRFTGVGFMDDPADPTADVFEVAASKGFEEKPLENASFSEEDVPTYGADDPFQDIYTRYGDTEAQEVSDEDRASLPDSAFAAVYSSPDGHAKIRKLPLSKDGKAPHAGLVKAAMEALSNKGFRGERVQLPAHVHAEARNKVRAAHDKLFPNKSGEKASMSPEEIAKIEDPLKREIAQLQADHAAALVAKDNTATEQSAAFQNQIDDLKAVVTERDTEIGSLKEEIAKRDREALGSKRFAELSAIEGYDVADEEKSALLEALGKESETEFTIRKQGIEISMLRAGKGAAAAAKVETKSETAEEKAAREIRESEEQAALEHGLDFLPKYDHKHRNDVLSFI